MHSITFVLQLLALIMLALAAIFGWRAPGEAPPYRSGVNLLALGLALWLLSLMVH